MEPLFFRFEKKRKTEERPVTAFQFGLDGAPCRTNLKEVDAVGLITSSLSRQAAPGSALDGARLEIGARALWRSRRSCAGGGGHTEGSTIVQAGFSVYFPICLQREG